MSQSGYRAPTIGSFKEYFSRDFIFGEDLDKVQDRDLEKARDRAKGTINVSVFPDGKIFDSAFLYLMAHFLVSDLNRAKGGASKEAKWIANSVSVGGVSVSQSIPERILNNPFYSVFSKDAYGQEYLKILFPYLTGVIYPSLGATTA